MFLMLFFVDLIYCIAFALFTKGDTPDNITNEEYNSACTKWRLGAWVPLIVQSIIFLICIVVGGGDCDLDILIPSFLCWMMDLLFSAIRSVCSSGYLVRLASSVQEELTEETIKNIKGEKTNQVAGTAAIIGGTIHTAKHTKNAIKDLAEGK